MPICALTPTVRIYEDFDKMSAKEVYFNESGDKIIVKLLHDQSEILKSSSDGAKNFPTDDSATSSSASNSAMTGDTSKTKRPHRKFSDGRKRSTSSQVYKCSKAFAETHHNSTMPSQTISVRKNSVGSKQSGSIVSASSNVATVVEPVKLKQPYVSRRYLSGPSSSAGGLRKQILTRQSVSPSAIVDDYDIIGTSLSTGYMQYQMSLLAVPMPRDYGDASSDDLSSEWDSDVPAERQSPKVNKKILT